MLNVQHIPLSVGIGEKIAAQFIGFPFQEQDFKTDDSKGFSDVTP